LFTLGNFVDYKGLFGLKEEGGGMKKSRIELVENKLFRLILLYSILLPLIQTGYKLGPKVEKFCHQTIVPDIIISSRRYTLGFI